MNKAVFVVTSLALATPASAQPELRLSLGMGAAAAYHEPCGYQAPEGCMGTRNREAGGAPFMGAGIRGTFRLSTNWRWRVGATASAIVVSPGGDESSQIITGAGEIGLERGRIAVDMIVGASRVRLYSDDDVVASGGTPMFGWSLTGRLSDTLAMFGRADLHAMMHAPTGGAFIGFGLEWTPKY